ncbi:hypothetical protein Tco_0005892 [Tanacetum coccineum]
MTMTLSRQDSMLIRFLLRSFKKKRDKSLPSKREPSSFMIPLLLKGDFLLNKDMRSDENFIAIGSVEDEMLIKDLNKKAVSIKKENSIKKESKEEEAPDEDKEVDYEILDKKYPIIEWKSEYLGNKPQLDKDDLNVVYQLVMDRYQDEIPEGFDRVLWGDLMIMFNPSDEDEFWNSQHNWNVYPLRKKVLLQLLKLKLESEEDSTMALELIRFVKKLIVELEPEDSDGDEEDL